MINTEALVEKIVCEVIAQLKDEKPQVEKRQVKAEFEELGIAKQGSSDDEVVVAVSPGFGVYFHKSIIDIPLKDVIREVVAGISEEGLKFRVIRVNHTADAAFIAHTAAKISGSGVGIGILSRGTTVIHHKDLQPLNNLELFPQCPLMDLETFRAVGKNAAKYAKGESPEPVPVVNDQMARPRYQALAALMHNFETKYIKAGAKPVELSYSFK